MNQLLPTSGQTGYPLQRYADWENLAHKKALPKQVFLPAAFKQGRAEEINVKSPNEILIREPVNKDPKDCT